MRCPGVASRRRANPCPRTTVSAAVVERIHFFSRRLAGGSAEFPWVHEAYFSDASSWFGKEMEISKSPPTWDRMLTVPPNTIADFSTNESPNPQWVPASVRASSPRQNRAKALSASSLRHAAAAVSDGNLDAPVDRRRPRFPRFRRGRHTKRHFPGRFERSDPPSTRRIRG